MNKDDLVYIGEREKRIIEKADSHVRMAIRLKSQHPDKDVFIEAVFSSLSAALARVEVELEDLKNQVKTENEGEKIKNGET